MAGNILDILYALSHLNLITIHVNYISEKKSPVLETHVWIITKVEFEVR